MGVKKARSRRDSGGGIEPPKVERQRPQPTPMTTPIETLTKDQLKHELKKRGLRMTGTKMELLQRLGNVMATVKRKTESFSSGQVNGDTRKPSSKMLPRSREEEKAEREKLVLWRRPVQVLSYFLKEFWYNANTFAERAMQYRVAVACALLVLVNLYVMNLVNGPHSKYMDFIRRKAIWCLYWLGLGVLSSVGLGTGLHTFLLYLGPHIATVTLAAYECGTLNFPQPPYPDEIICPDKPDTAWGVSILNIMSKVRLEAMMWGAGTALGELPPYFMARAARLSGYDPDDKDDLREFEELQKKRQNPESMSMMDRAKLGVERVVEKVGFLGILACASIPNPLFDLAGITCGHFLVPFWTFFGATLIGKAIIKMHIQKMFVIIAFNETLLEKAVALLALVPYVGHKLQEPFKEFLIRQKQRLHRRADSELPAEGNLLSSIFEKFVIAMILYFVVSIVNSLAQSHHKRICKERRNPSAKHAKD